MSVSEDRASVLPYTGKEFLDSLDDDREVWIYASGSRTSPSILPSATRPG
jgi:hypothetical protein